MARNYFSESASDITSKLLSAAAITPPAGGTASYRPSALSTRITSVLSASYADLDIRDALATLDARGIQNTQETRRNLRLDLQKEIIQCNGGIVQDFGRVSEVVQSSSYIKGHNLTGEQQLNRVGAAISSLNHSCAYLRAQISAASRQTGPVLEEATVSMSQRSQAETKQHLLDAFNAHFIVSEIESTVVTSVADPVNEEFFRVLDRVKKIHQDCQILLGTEDQRLGLEILEQSSKQLNAGFQKLFRWVQREFKTLNLENPRISSSIRRSLRVLAQRPRLFQSCLNFLAEAREHTLSDAFYGALTGSTSGPEQASSSKPIEFNTHDPLRYVGDMFAWVHSAIVSEREALEVLFVSEGDEIAKDIRAGIESEPWSRPERSEEVFDGKRALKELVNRDLTGVLRLLRQRTEQVIQSQEDAALSYRIANLIGFYTSIFAKLLGEDAAVLEVYTSLKESALRQFRANMKDHITAVQSELAVAPSDLSPPEFLEEALETLQVLLKSYDTSLTVADNHSAAFEPVLAEALNPFISGCENLCKRIEEPGNHIFAINCLLAVRAILAPFAFTSERVSEIDSDVQEHASKLIEYQHRYLQQLSGLHSLLLTLASLSDSPEDLASVSSLGLFKPDSLVAASQTLDGFLPSALMDAMENLKQLQNTKMAQEITEEAAGRFCEGFDFIESRILAADELREMEGGAEGQQGPSLRELFPRTSAEIRVLLS